jgi:putative ABC transport system permease protein
VSAALSFKLAYRHARAAAGRMALSVVAVALGVALVVAFRLMNAAVLQSFLDTADAMAGRAALSVTAGDGLTFSEDVVQAVAAVPGVKLAVPLVRSVAFVDDGSGEMLTVHGVDLTNESAVRVYHDAEHADEVIDDPVGFLNQPDSVVVGREFAERHGLTTESRLALVTPSGVRQVTIRGLLAAQGLVSTLRGRLVVMDLYAAERMFTADGQINQIDVLVMDGQAVEATKTAVSAVLPAGLKVEEPALRKHVLRETVAAFQAMVTAFSLLAVVAGFVISYSRLSAIFAARTWEVGLLRAVGMPQTTVFVELLKESVLLGGCGTVVGMGLGSLIGHYALPALAATTAIALKTPEPAAEAALRADAFALGAAVGLLAALGAAVVPALRLAGTQPVVALTMRGREMESKAKGAPSRWRVRWMLVLLLGGLFVWQPRAHSVAIGHAITGLIMICTCALAAPYVKASGRLVHTIMARALGPWGTIGTGHLTRQPGRTTLTVATLGVGLGTVLLFGMLGRSFERTLVFRLTDRFRTDLVVSSAFVSGGYREAPVKESVVDELRRIPGVAIAVGNQSKDIQYGDGAVVLDSYDRQGLIDPRVFTWRLEPGALPNALEDVASGTAVMLSSAFAHQHGTRPGESVELRSPRGDLSLRVAAVTSGQAENAIVMARDVYRAAWNDDTIYQVHVVLQPGADRSTVEREIAGRLGVAYRLQVRSSHQLVEYLAGQVRQAFSPLYLMQGITFVLVLIAIGDTLAAGVVERIREFGMLRAVGLSRPALFGMVMLEGGVIGLLGLLLAAVSGVALGIFWVEVQFPAILGWELHLHFPTSFALSAAALAMLLCLGGSFLPSLRAARMSVPQALRHE